MRVRSDGVETRKRVLTAACAVFVEKGFRDATIAEICDRAGTNTASVNYHFRDKESLYVEVWRHTAQRAHALYPCDGNVPEDAPAEDRLRELSGAVSTPSKPASPEAQPPVTKPVAQPAADESSYQRLTERLLALAGYNDDPEFFKRSMREFVMRSRQDDSPE